MGENTRPWAKVPQRHIQRGKNPKVGSEGRRKEGGQGRRSDWGGLAPEATEGRRPVEWDTGGSGGGGRRRWGARFPSPSPARASR